jgi:hypothetical protein
VQTAEQIGGKQYTETAPVAMEQMKAWEGQKKYLMKAFKDNHRFKSRNLENQ